MSAYPLLLLSLAVPSLTCSLALSLPLLLSLGSLQQVPLLLLVGQKTFHPLGRMLTAADPRSSWGVLAHPLHPQGRIEAAASDKADS